MSKNSATGKSYHNRYVYRDRCRYLGHKLSLAETEEEFTHYWDLYRNNLEKWRKLEVPGTRPDQIPVPLRRKTFYRPVFNEEYSVKDYRILSPPKRTQQ
ncbi:MAG: hypothetical protein LUB63_03875, partial [Oscillospiraceae bacterium]|nr:hypothetical protein [Oscillospiraceae bacterium]